MTVPTLLRRLRKKCPSLFDAASAMVKFFHAALIVWKHCVMTIEKMTRSMHALVFNAVIW
jgi:hypothetical protein